jgi:predicted Zn-dependent protease
MRRDRGDTTPAHGPEPEEKSPMSVRWKPLLVLSGLFLVTGVLGILAFTLRTSAGDVNTLLASARAERQAGRFGNAQIHFLRAKQQQPRNAALHLELAGLCEEWAAREPARREGLRRERLSALAEAAKFGTDPEPRRLLLLDALDHEDDAQAADWARKLQELDRDHPDAHFAMARAALTTSPADPGAAEPHVTALAGAEPDRPRTRWLRARLAEVQKQDAALADVLGRSRDLPARPGEDLTDRTSRLRLAQLDALHAADATARAAAIGTLKAVAQGLVADPDAPAIRLATVGLVLDDVRDRLARRPDAAPDAAGADADGLAGAAEASYRKALETAAVTDLNIYRDYADHLLDREQRDRCLELVNKALKQTVATLPAWADTVMRLREVAIKAALLDPADPKRYEKAEPHIKALIASTVATQQAIGHLFQGVIELDRSGLAGAGANASSPALRTSAVNHLKIAAAGLPDAATAQALYGVALLLTGEPALGRQYLVGARRAPDLEPRYRLWCAWAMVQSGYPEEAEADLKVLEAAAAKPGSTPDLVASVGLLRGEVLQAKGTPAALAEARKAFEAALAAGGPRTPALEMRLAQLDAALGDPAKALRRVEAIRARGDGGPAAELQAVGLLVDAKQVPKARESLAAARKRYPDSAALVLAEARLLVGDAKADAADALLAEFLGRYPRELEVLQARAGLLAGPLKRPDEARALLAAAAETADTSAPLVQLARVDFDRGDLDGVAATVAKIRGRWQETAVADLLDAELALRRQDVKGALARLDTALAKDPSNKLARFWKAQIEDSRGDNGATAAVYEAIARENTSKEIDDGLSLAAAARWALASQAMQDQDIGGAIARYEEMLKDRSISPEIARAVRWKLVAARVAKGQWAAAKPEMEGLLREKTTTEEWVRAANFYRVNDEPARTAQVLDGLLKKEPGYPPAVAIRAYLLASDQPAEAAALIRRAIAAGPQPPSLYLMLAGVENKLPPKDTGVARAIAAIADGLKAHAGSTELIKGRYLLLRLAGDPSAALAGVREAAKADPSGAVGRLLVELLREEDRLDEAAQALAEQVAARPTDPALAWSLVQLTATRSARSAAAGDRARAAALDAETLAVIKRCRAAFPDDLAFLQAECEYAARHREFDRALALTKELDRLDPKSPAGPALRGQIARARNAAAVAADEFAEAVSRAPRRLDLRLALGQASLPAGRVDDAIQQAEFILQNRSDQNAAILLKARALAVPAATPGLTHERRQQAVAILRDALAKAPAFSAAAHLMAEVQLQDGDRPGAVTTLTEALARAQAQRKARPEAADELATSLSLVVQALAEPRPDGTPAPAADLARADALVAQYAAGDATGALPLAASMGYQRAGQVGPARTWAEAATKGRDDWVAHLNLGDILLAQAEAEADSPTARDLFEKAVASYDRVLAQNPDSIEAVNNKAWVLHQYLDRNDEALKLCETLVRGASPDAIPADLWDTIGSIYEALRRPKEAEAAYDAGLERDADHAVLNFHLGRLLAADRARAGLAASHLRKAESGRDGLTPAMADELKSLLARADR